jgi:glucose-fructose oxidoreductase
MRTQAKRGSQTSRSAKSSKRKQRKVRYAVVGLGYISQAAVLPAFANASRNSELVALVSDDPVKLKSLSRKYGVNLICSYDQYDDCLASGEIDAVYIALPNHLHRIYTELAAKAGIHVLCEKPMATSVSECKDMLEVVRENGVKLMIAYRLHFEAANLKAVELVESGKLGEPRIFNSLFTMQVKEGDIRLLKETGGGTLWDIGIYCLNAARYLFKDEPTEVFATTANNGQERFAEVEEMTSAILHFPGDRLASFTVGFGEASVSAYQVIGTKGDLRVDPAYEYAEDLRHLVTINGKTRERVFPKRDQFAPELIAFSDAILNRKEPSPSGLEGMADVRIIEALYRSAESGKPVKLGDFETPRRPTMAQEIRRPPVEKPELVHAESPSGKN